MNLGRILTSDCVNAVPPTDPRCQDQAFALANPDICPVQPQLLIKPGLALACQLGSVQFKAFLITGTTEVDVTKDSIFTTSDANVAVIGARSGNATGLLPGQVTISAAYQDKMAFAELNVLAGSNCCSQTHVAMLLMVDTSRSMSQSFGGLYSTRLNFAKAAATRFISEVNATKDSVGLMSFNGVDHTVLALPEADKGAVGALVPTIAQTQQKTEFFNALSTAIDTLTAVTADEKVIVLISDGEDTSGPYGENNNPIASVENFRAQGGVVICLGTRASGKGFLLLEALATGGFFINSYSDIAPAALDLLSGLKGYICAGNCTPAGDLMVGQGQLRYDKFINWDVLGSVDLEGNGFFDLLPGNGLYVEMAGISAGTLQSKTPFALQANHQYRVSLDIAGNQRLNIPQSVRIRAFYTSTPNQFLLDQQVALTDYTQPFQRYSFSFTVHAAGDVKFSIAQETVQGQQESGVFIDRVKIEDATDLVTLLYDDFDSENVHYIPPRCGVGSIWALLDLNTYGYASGYNCYGYGCLESPPGVQSPDPKPLPDIESGYVPPKEYSSTKTVTINCTAGQLNFPAPDDPGLIPVQTGSTSAVTSFDEVGGFDDWRAFSQAANNIGWIPGSNNSWIQFRFSDGIKADLTALTFAQVTRTAKFTYSLQGSLNSTDWITLLPPTLHDGNGLIDDFELILNNTDAYVYYRWNFVVTSGQVQVLSLWLGNLAGGETATATATSEISQADADQQATDAATAQATALLRCRTVYSATETVKLSCPPTCYGLDSYGMATAISLTSLDEAQRLANYYANAQAQAGLDCTKSNNTQPIVINDSFPSAPAPATPYPSVHYVTGANGLLIHLVVSLKNFTHTYPSDVHVLLRGPTGVTCLLMRKAGSSFAVSGIDLTFDDDAVGYLPQNAALTSGTYRPTQYGAVLPFPLPAPQPPYGTQLSVFTGTDPNGCWSIWVIDDKPLDTGSIGGGFQFS